MNIFKKRKAKRMIIGVDSLSKAADRIKVLDKVLALFKMRIGADTMEIDATNGKIIGIKLTVYFIEWENTNYANIKDLCNK